MKPDVYNMIIGSKLLPSGGGGSIDSLIDKSISGDVICNVTSVGDSAFVKCSNITSIKFPNVTSIAKNTVFTNCSSLSEITLGTSTVITYIGNQSFYDTPFYLGGDGGTVYVPSDVVETYRTGWGKLLQLNVKNQILPIA